MIKRMSDDAVGRYVFNLCDLSAVEGHKGVAEIPIYKEDIQGILDGFFRHATTELLLWIRDELPKRSEELAEHVKKTLIKAGHKVE